jgi:RNA polymerase sigma-70 factor (ECF subfamily)
MSEETPSSPEKLVLLLAQNQESIFRYIFCLTPVEADARDILQETSLALYRKWDQFDTARPFLPWAFRFAYLQVQKHREKSARTPLLFSPDVLDLLASEREHVEDQLELRLQLLDVCLQKLPVADKELVTSRYARRESAEALMQKLNLSRRSLFRRLELLRQRLHDCVTRQLETER